jgi:hypothetical protein
MVGKWIVFATANRTEPSEVITRSRTLSQYQFEHASNDALDGAIGLGAVTWPLWVQLLQTTGYIITFVGGMILLGLRIAIAWRDLCDRRRNSGVKG